MGNLNGGMSTTPRGSFQGDGGIGVVGSLGGIDAMRGGGGGGGRARGSSSAFTRECVP